VAGWALGLPALAQPAAPAALRLPDVIAQAQAHSVAGQQAQVSQQTGYWLWRSYQANYRPQLGLAGTLPSFIRGVTPVGQPNGTTDFPAVRNNNAVMALTLSQNVGSTGGQVYVSSQMTRFDDFIKNERRYNNQPFTLGFVQPLGQFNALAWARRIEPLRYQESQRQYVEDRETVAQRVTELYFDLLLQQVNAAVARQNVDATAELLRVGQERFRLGRLSQNDLLQLELNLLNAQQAQEQAQLEAETTALNLQSYTGLPSTEALPALEVPARAPRLQVAPEQALEQARQNRSTTLALHRRLLEAERSVAQARGTTGLQASLSANIGYVNQARNFGDTYLNLQDQQELRFTFSLPVVDWGRRRAAVRTAELARDQATRAVAQETQTFEQTVRTQATQLPRLALQVARAARADSLAQQRYAITQATYKVGRLSLTDLTLASAAKDLARRDYIAALRAAWVAHYRLRALTLYDFERMALIATN